MLNNAPINDKLLIAAGVTLTCTVIIGVWSVFQFEKLYIETKKFDEYWLPSINSANNLQRTLTTLHGTLYSSSELSTSYRADSVSMPGNKSKRESESTHDLTSAIATMRQSYQRSTRSAAERELLLRFDSTTTKEYLPRYRRAFALTHANGRIPSNADSVFTAVAEANRVFGDVLSMSNKLIDDNSRRTDEVASEILRHFLFSRLLVTVSLVAAIIISLGVNWLIARSIVRRLRLIQIAAERISYGNLQVQIAMNEPDEIGRLARAFNRMTANLRETLDNLANEQIRERQAQLEALQAQLAPHFLFNSLTALGGLIMSNKTAAIEFLEKLSYTYRYVLMHRQQHLVTVEDELNFVQAYTFLASIRFKEGFDMRMDVAKEYRHYKLPSMTLQLLLENAVKHNILSAQNPLRISLTVESRQHPVTLQHVPYLTVRNNVQRRTMSINDLMTISANTQQNTLTDSTKVGLQNLQHRYLLLTNQTPKIIEESEQFTVILPLIAPGIPSEPVVQGNGENKL